MIRKWTRIALTAVLVAGILSAPMPVMPVSDATWNPALGWDFQCHSHSHSHPRARGYNIRWEMEQVNAAFQEHLNTTPTHHAYPYGDMDDEVKAIVAEYRKSGRGVSGNMETYPVSDWHEVKAAQLNRSTPWAEAKGWVDDCITNNALLVIFTHDVEENPSTYGVTPENLTQLVDYVVEKKKAGLLQVMAMAEAYDYWTTASEGEPTVVFTFDDGWVTDYTSVYPLFKERGLKGTSYITTSLVREEAISRLSWKQIEEMRAPRSSPQFIIYVVLGLGAVVFIIIVLVLILRRRS